MVELLSWLAPLIVVSVAVQFAVGGVLLFAIDRWRNRRVQVHAKVSLAVVEQAEADKIFAGLTEVGITSLRSASESKQLVDWTFFPQAHRVVTRAIRPAEWPGRIYVDASKFNAQSIQLIDFSALGLTRVLANRGQQVTSQIEMAECG